MPASYRIRVELADEPGALAAIVGAIALHEANVTSIDIHESTSGRAVDEILVQTQPGAPVGGLAEAIGALAGVKVLHLEPEDRGDDPTVSSLRWSRIMLAAGAEGSDLELTRAMLEVTRASVAWVVTASAAAAVGVGRDALDRGAVASATVESLPEGIEVEPGGPYCLVAAPDDPAEPKIIGFAARPVAVPFSSTELARLGALLALHRQVMSLLGRSARRPAPVPVLR